MTGANNNYFLRFKTFNNHFTQGTSPFPERADIPLRWSTTVHGNLFGLPCVVSYPFPESQPNSMRTLHSMEDPLWEEQTQGYRGAQVRRQTQGYRGARAGRQTLKRKRGKDYTKLREDGPKLKQDAAKLGQDGDKWGRVGTKWSQDWAKEAPS